MAVTFQKRQKEMNRLEKQRMKEEHRAQKKLEKRARVQEAAETASPAVDKSEPSADRDGVQNLGTTSEQTLTNTVPNRDR